MSHWPLVIDPSIAQFWDQFTAYGDLLLVGGAVRDGLRGDPIHDWDFSTSLSPSAVTQALTDLGYPVSPVGSEFGTVPTRVGEWEIQITTFRSEAGYTDHRHPLDVAFVTSVEQDLARRDLTINAMALRHDGQIVDPFGGYADLVARRIRMVGSAVDRIHEDPLRILRAIRFTARYQGTRDAELNAAIATSQDLLQWVSRERQRDELWKLLMLPRDAMIRGIQDWHHYQLGREIFPEWMETDATPALDRLRHLDSDQPLVRWATVGLDLPDAVIRARMQQMGCANRDIATTIAIRTVASHQWEHATEADIRCWRHAVETDEWVHQGRHVASVSHDIGDDVHTIFDREMARPRLVLAMTGHQMMEILQRPSGVWMKAMKQAMWDWVILHPTENTLDALTAWMKQAI